MSDAIESKLDASVLHALRAKRRARERQAGEKLRLLHRLRRRLNQGAFPKETSAEASFVEQLFAKLFGYSTLLSDDEPLYSLYAKPYIKISNRYPDVGLGAFETDGEACFASMELKGPQTDLDQAQGGDNYDGLSPVQQAFRAVKGQKKCRWVLVSNMNELRVYKRTDLADDKETPPDFVARAYLDKIFSRNDLAMLCAHFDRAALLGAAQRGAAMNTFNPEESELMKAHKKESPIQPIEGSDDGLRLNIFFTPSRDEDIALSFIERKLRKAIEECAPHIGAMGYTGEPNTIKLERGSIHLEWGETSNPTLRISMSGEGQLMMSLRKEAKNKKIEAAWLVKAVGYFFHLSQAFFRDLGETPGFVMAELREVKGILLEAVAPDGEADMPSEGKCESSELMTVDFRYKPVFDEGERLTMDVVNELAVYFRSAKGGVVVSGAAMKS